MDAQGESGHAKETKGAKQRAHEKTNSCVHKRRLEVWGRKPKD
jgi:hypothetical protein